ncbi:FkbM family methyltransferase [Halorussus halophilus]|uniref:FkbM family methyltransferase n=1 Tax=Halorussus halophilus TaxID=2650975 RepID=UPI0013017824|nr:FkbM family methyltransferase [Halorussus halophilus]
MANQVSRASIPAPVGQAMLNAGEYELYAALSATSRQIAVPAGPEFELTVLRDSWLSQVADDTGFYEPLTTATLLDELGPSSTFLDVGAGQGYFSFLATHVTDASDVHAFDPHPVRSKVFERNDADLTDSRVNFHPTWVGEDTSDDPPDDHTTNVQSLEKYPKATTDQTTLDRYCVERNVSPSLVKIDVEGGESSVLRGLSSVLERDAPALLVELHPGELRDRFDTDPWSLVERLEAFGYDVRYTNDYNDPVAEWCEDPPEKLRWTSMLYCTI